VWLRTKGNIQSLRPPTSPQASAERWPLRGVCLLASALRTGSEGVPLSNTDRASRDDPLMR
jgi:hypothetical protein